MHPEDKVSTSDLQGCSRQSTLNVVEDMINRNINEQATLLKLKQWLNYNPPPREVEEYLWNILAFNRK